MAHRLRFPSSHLSKVLSISQSVSQQSVHTPDNADSEADYADCEVRTVVEEKKKRDRRQPDTTDRQTTIVRWPS